MSQSDGGKESPPGTPSPSSPPLNNNTIIRSVKSASSSSLHTVPGRRVRFREEGRQKAVRHSLGSGQPHSTAERNPLDSSSSSAVNYIPMNEASFDYTAEQFELRVHPPKQYRCLCGQIHVVLGTKLFLILYVVLTMFGLVFGMVQAMVWTGIPFLVTVMTIYGFCRKKHKYLYPFLIISVVQLIVCLIMGLVIATFSVMNYETLKMILAHNMKSEASTTMIVAIVGGTVFSCFLLAIIHVWQVMVIYSCLQYYEYDLRPDRALVSTHGDPTNNGFSFFESTQKIPHNIDALASLNSEMQQRRAEMIA